MILTDSGSRPYDISNDVMKSDMSTISDDNISGTGCPIGFMFDSRVFRDGRSNGATSSWTKSKTATGCHLGNVKNDDIFGTGRLINFMFNSSCLLSATSEPHRLPACVTLRL